MKHRWYRVVYGAKMEQRTFGTRRETRDFVRRLRREGHRIFSIARVVAGGASTELEIT